MESQTLTTPADEKDIDAIAENLDKQALVNVGKQDEVISNVVEEQRDLVDKWAKGEELPEEAKVEPLIPEGAGNDGASLDGSFESPREELKEEVQAKMDKIHTNRMKEVRGDESTHLTIEPDRVLGHFDGEEKYLDALNGVDQATYDHETQHEKDGFDTKITLDEGIAEEIRKEFEESLGITLDENDEMFTLSQRAVLEKRATEKGGKTPAQYEKDFVRPTLNIEKRIDAAGLNGKEVLGKLIVNKNVEGFREAARITLLNEQIKKAA